LAARTGTADHTLETAVTITSILCVVGLPAESRGVLQRALAIARQDRAWLTVLQVLDPSLMPSVRGGHDGRFLKAADQELLARIGEASKEAGMDAMAVRRRVRVGPAVSEILAEAEEIDADLLVMGRDSFKRVDGNVGDESPAARVRLRSGRPVLLLPPDDTTSGEESSPETFAHAASEGTCPADPVNGDARLRR
jgi:nucleotide-binding universal stress UspA family protein